MSDADIEWLSQLERRVKRQQIIHRHPPMHRRPPRPKQGPVYGPPAPPGFQSQQVQAKAAAARVGKRNAARSKQQADEECEAILQILRQLERKMNE